MENKKVETIKVSGGAEYARVTARLKKFHELYKNGSIETEYNLTEAMICFKTKITPNTEQTNRFFTGHSLGKIAGVKAFEKLETVSVGRALAFLGLLADGDIASYEEMQEYEEDLKPENVKASKIDDLKSQVDSIKTIPELKTFYAKHKGLGKEFDTHVALKAKELGE